MKETCLGNQEDQEYEAYLASIRLRFAQTAAKGGGLFTTLATGLWGAYLSAFPESERQFYNCNACRRFIERFGGLVSIDENGLTKSAIWDLSDAPERYKAPVRAMLQALEGQKVTGVFLSNETEWGNSLTGDWTHFSVIPTSPQIYSGLTKTPGQAMAEKREDYKNVSTALGLFSPEVLAQAVTLLKSDALYRSEKVLGPAEWLQKLQQDIHATRKRKANLVWSAIASAPAGFCHPRSSMVGTLLDDIASGDFQYAEVAARFASKMDGLSYQRPQAPASAGNIEQAEKLIAQMGVRASLARRFARLEDLSKLWTPTPAAAAKAPEGDSVFGHLTPKGKGVNTLDLDRMPPLVMSWDKFNRTVLPDALDIELFINGASRYPFAALVTAVDPDAPIILQWDNPVSWYLYHGGSQGHQWGLSHGFQKVTAVTLKPSMWGGSDQNTNQGEGVFFILDGAIDSENNSLALFPETLKSELHSVRSTIEAFSQAGKLEGRDRANACGVAFFAGHETGTTLKVRTEAGTLVYKLDRWD